MKKWSFIINQARPDLGEGFIQTKINQTEEAYVPTTLSDVLCKSESPGPSIKAQIVNMFGEEAYVPVSLSDVLSKKAPDKKESAVEGKRQRQLMATSQTEEAYVAPSLGDAIKAREAQNAEIS